MAKKSNLREFQESILLKLKNAAEQGDLVSTTRLGVTVGSKKLLIDLNDITEVILVPAVQPVPLTQSWFLGVANVRGNLFNVADFAQFIGQPAEPKAAGNRVLLLSSQTTTQAALLISSLIGLRNIDTLKVKPINQDIEFSYCKTAYEDADGDNWYEVDMQLLMNNDNFVQPTLM